MTADIRDLYRQVLLDHSRQPQNYRVIDRGASAEGCNPLCGDRVTVYVKVDGDVIRDASFRGSACAIVMASASLMTERVKGLTVADATVLRESLERMIATPVGAQVADLGGLTVLAGVRMFPSRIKCATLPWAALRDALRCRVE